MANVREKSDIRAGVLEVLEEIRPSLAMHGGNAALLGIEDGVVKLKLEGACQGCPMSVITFGVAMKEMLLEKFPNEIKDVVWQ